MSDNKIIENENIKSIAGTFSRAPFQLNALLESDAELIQFDSENILAMTYDAIVEEIEEGLYTDNYQIGWMAVTTSVSDLAAVGAKVLGLLLDLKIPKEFRNTDLSELQRGINDACKFYGCHILGGDTNANKTLQIGSTAIGFCKNKLMRTGMQTSDILYTSGKMGLGSSYAYSRFMGDAKIEYLPKAKIKEGQLLSKFASSCIDTSDGLFPAICQLMELNNLGINLTTPLNDILHKTCLKISEEKQLPNWIFMCGPHGEYELLFTIPSDKIKKFETEAKRINWNPTKIGDVDNKSKLFTNVDGFSINIFDTTNLYNKNNIKSPQQYMVELLKLDKDLRL
ncbi:thiamine-phosphate kinase [Seonamhaeicola aphaedonensis]|uniref:Thiamine-monophosphate kinase n=1 Tax=Seonamhaeicola aphaedonensis TaxID=1461338 RepID=A0A3D9HKZ9_9FLAO|nr:thiamine-phosphate kinase [Seonamhaeicola aphaedonensis]RED50148.1 thiamine-monophosphate kinase [Seonamhaeicola aphaedonensis]